MPELKESQELTKLKSFLNQLFQFESQDLDFGIYKILNFKRKEIKNFIDNLLTNEVKTQLNLLNEAEHKKLKDELAELEKEDVIKGYIKAKDEKTKEVLINVSKDKIEYYLRLKEQVSNLTATSNAEPIIYNHLTIFFSRYYDKGDFISKRRYGKNEKYVVPYNGEETYFYWANNDQYYIKSSEFFKKYAFKLDKTNQIVNFRIKEAEEETGNVKSENNKYFVLAENPVEASEKEINIYFEYRSISVEEKTSKGKKQDELNQYSAEQIKKGLGKDKSVEELYKYINEEKKLCKILYELNRYTNRNSYDFFIHKDLKGFLTRELDFYIKNEMLNLDDLTVFDTETHLEKVRLSFNTIKTFKHIATTIIDFVSQIEDFQRKLWEKKKFVINTEYVITLDKLAEYTSTDFTNKIVNEAIKNQKQINEWLGLFGNDILPQSIKVKDILDNEGNFKKLPIDTTNFSEPLKWEIITEITKTHDLNYILNGIVIRSDNFHGLSLLSELLYRSVQCIYTDPPYNTDATEIIYKNGFKHSSWTSLLYDRLELSTNLLNEKGMACITIDDAEYNNLLYLSKKIFGHKNYLATVAIRNNPSGRSTVTGFSVNHEYALFFSGIEEVEKVGSLPHNIKQIERYSEIEQDGRKYEWENLRRNGPESNRNDRPKQYYPIYINTESKSLRVPKIEWINENKEWTLLEEPNVFEKKIYPIHPDGQEKVWRYSKENIEKEPGRFCWKIVDDRIEIYRKKYLNPEGLMPRTWWDKPSYSARDSGKREIVNLFNGEEDFDFPKAVDAVKDCIVVCNADDEDYILDFFSGSGTTFQAVQTLNIDGGNRKALLLEQGNYVETLIIPRAKKIAYSFDWKKGKPLNMDGLGVFFKYQRLEQYEEALENIAFTNGEDTEQIQIQYKDYIPKYFLNFETQNSNTFLNLEELKNPFNYNLKVFDNYQYKEQAVDVIETFNYLIGLYVQKYEILENNSKKYYFVYGSKRDKKKALIIWRDVTKIDYDEDKKFITSQIKNYVYDTLYVNHQASIEGYETIENVFKNKMN